MPRYLKNTVNYGAATPLAIRQTGSNRNDSRKWPVLSQAKHIVEMNLPRVSFCKADDGRFGGVAGGSVKSIINCLVVLYVNIATH